MHAYQRNPQQSGNAYSQGTKKYVGGYGFLLFQLIDYAVSPNYLCPMAKGIALEGELGVGWLPAHQRGTGEWEASE